MTEEEIQMLPYRPCVGVMLMNTEGLVFVGQRIDHGGPAWQMPQGGIDAGEEPRQAALRELEEETGVGADAVSIVTQTDDWVKYELPVDLVPKIWNGRFRGQQQLWFLMRLEAKDTTIDIETDKPEFSTWKWMHPGDLLENIVPFKREVYSTVINEFKQHLVARR